MSSFKNPVLLLANIYFSANAWEQRPHETCVVKVSVISRLLLSSAGKLMVCLHPQEFLLDLKGWYTL